MNVKKISQTTKRYDVDIFTSTEQSKIIQFLQAEDEHQSTPLISRVLAGLGAWLSSLLILPFLAVSEIIQSKTGLVSSGTIFIILAIVISQALTGEKAKASPYLNQLALMLALAGNALFVIGIGLFYQGAHKSFITAILFSHILVGSILYVFLNNIVYRFLVPVFTLVLIFIYQLEHRTHLPVNVTFILVSIVFTGLFYMDFLNKKILPLFYSCALLLPAIVVLSDMSKKFLWLKLPQLSDLVMIITVSIVLVLMIIKIFNIQKATNFIIAGLSCIFIIVLSFISTPAILVTLALLICGHYLCDNYLLSLGYISLPVSLFYYYYSLHMTLIDKSYLLLSTALALFLLYAILLLWQKKGLHYGE